MNDVRARRAVVAGHAQFADGMLSAVRQIVGDAGTLVGVTNSGASGEEIERRLRDALADSGASVIFTDLPAGSCTMAARRLQRADPSLTVVVGANVPAILDFVMGEDAEAGALASRAVDRGRTALVLVQPPTPR